jgi:heat shock protein HspQ
MPEVVAWARLEETVDRLRANPRPRKARRPTLHVVAQDDDI